jgi:hypothetical protein
MLLKSLLEIPARYATLLVLETARNGKSNVNSLEDCGQFFSAPREQESIYKREVATQVLTSVRSLVMLCPPLPITEPAACQHERHAHSEKSASSQGEGGVG